MELINVTDEYGRVHYVNAAQIRYVVNDEEGGLTRIRFTRNDQLFVKESAVEINNRLRSIALAMRR